MLYELEAIQRKCVRVKDISYSNELLEGFNDYGVIWKQAVTGTPWQPALLFSTYGRYI